MVALSKALLVILIGIYAIRASWFMFSGVFSPLTPVAAIVMIVCVLAFHNQPTSTGAWFYTLIAMCVIGAIANFSLLFATSAIYADPANRAFSAVSLVCFLGLGAMLTKTAAWS